MKINNYHLSTLLIVVIGLFLAYPGSILAQGQSISIYPPVIQTQATPPSSPTVPIIIQNNNNENITLKIQLIPFKTNGSNGKIILVPEQAEKGFYPYYKNRIQFLVDGKKTEEVQLQALESKEILLNINLTKGDPPGDFYYSIIFISNDTLQNESSTSTIPAGIATNLLLSVGPKSQSTGGIVEFSTSAFKSQGPVKFKLRLHNASQHLISPTGKIDVQNMFGKKVATINLLPQYVLAGTNRYLLDDGYNPTAVTSRTTQADNMPVIVWNENFLFGWYKASASILLEEIDQPITASTYFFAFPLYLFFGIVILLFILISVYLRVKKKI